MTWLDRADRDVLVTRPRDDPGRPLTGVFSTSDISTVESPKWS